MSELNESERVLSLSGDTKSVSQQLKNLRTVFRRTPSVLIDCEWFFENLEDTRMLCLTRENILTWSPFGSKAIRRSILKFWWKEISLNFCKREMSRNMKEFWIKKSPFSSKPSGAFDIILVTLRTTQLSPTFKRCHQNFVNWYKEAWLLAETCWQHKGLLPSNINHYCRRQSRKWWQTFVDMSPTTECCHHSKHRWWMNL